MPIKPVHMHDGWVALVEGVPLKTYEAQEVRKILVDILTHDERTGDLNTKVWLACALMQRLEQR